MLATLKLAVLGDTDQARPECMYTRGFISGNFGLPTLIPTATKPERGSIVLPILFMILAVYTVLKLTVLDAAHRWMSNWSRAPEASASAQPPQWFRRWEGRHRAGAQTWMGPRERKHDPRMSHGFGQVPMAAVTPSAISKRL
jgi:hypothetical protein